MIILGINSYHPDSSAAVIVNGTLAAACEEERFSRVKHFALFPAESIRYCLKEAGVSIKDVDYIALPRNPFARVFKKIFYGIKMPELARNRMPVWSKISGVKNDLAVNLGVAEDVIKAKIIPIEHHRAHLASSFFVSGFETSLLFSADALGDFASTMWAVGEGNKISVMGEVGFPDSLGLYYTALTQYLGFKNFGDEYKVMALAAYGEPSFESEFNDLLKTDKNGFRMGRRYFFNNKQFIDMDLSSGAPKIGDIFSPQMEGRLGPKRAPEEPIEKRHRDIACTMQNRLEYVMSDLVSRIAASAKMRRLCMAGGVAFNCAANGKLAKELDFEEIFIPPAPGDAGLAIGAAFYLWNNILGKPRDFVMEDAYWGSAYSEKEIEEAVAGLKESGHNAEKIGDKKLLCKKTAKLISEGKVTGWFQGRMEFGPRALGNRSILADPRIPEMKNILNDRIKKRESFRPFAPSVAEEYQADYFEDGRPSRFMLFTNKVKPEKKEEIPSVIHVDGTSRVQTVKKDSNPLFWELINEFKEITGTPVLLNTSFNENEPIVRTPEEAAECFERTKMDAMAIGNYLVKD